MDLLAVSVQSYFVNISILNLNIYLKIRNLKKFVIEKMFSIEEFLKKKLERSSREV